MVEAATASAATAATAVTAIATAVAVATSTPTAAAPIIDTESYLDLQESYRAYNFVSELEIRAVGVLSRAL